SLNRGLYSFPTRRSSDLREIRGIPSLVNGKISLKFRCVSCQITISSVMKFHPCVAVFTDKTSQRKLSKDTQQNETPTAVHDTARSEEHTSELQSRSDLVC